MVPHCNCNCDHVWVGLQTTKKPKLVRLPCRVSGSTSIVMPGASNGPGRDRQVTFVMAATSCDLEFYGLKNFRLYRSSFVSIWYYAAGDWDTASGNPDVYNGVTTSTTAKDGWLRVSKCGCQRDMMVPMLASSYVLLPSSPP
jgi:hypothetical protein